MELPLREGAYGSSIGVIGGGLAWAMPEMRWVGWVVVALGIGILVWGFLSQKKPNIKKRLVPAGSSLGNAVRYLHGVLPDVEDYDIGVRLLDAIRIGNLPARGRKYHKLHGGMRTHVCPLENIGAENLVGARYNSWWAIHRNNGPENIIETSDLEGWWDVVVDGYVLSQIWPSPNTI